jgi:asparagine synthase (glutamine-hydrolysing)
LNIKLDDASINLGDFQKLSPMYRQVYDICEVSVPVQVKSEDRNSMASSIETRAPFLDYRVVEFGISLPQNFKIKNGYGKWILRDVMKGYIPDEIRLARYKRGYDMSNDWIGMGLGSHIRQKLIDNEHAIQKFLKNRIDINYFSDSYLTNNINAIQEVSTLLWLCKKYN